MSELIGMLSSGVVITWIFNTAFISLFKRGLKADIPKVSSWIHNELKPLIPYIIIAHWMYHVLGSVGHPISNALEAGWSFYMWWQYKDVDDDDRWKKRKEKAVGVVKSLGHRLVIVNAGA